MYRPIFCQLVMSHEHVFPQQFLFFAGTTSYLAFFLASPRPRGPPHGSVPGCRATVFCLGHLMCGRLGVNANSRLAIGATHAPAPYASSMPASIGLTRNCRRGTWRLHTASRLDTMILQGILMFSPCCATIARQ